jgi:hypothetical protein
VTEPELADFRRTVVKSVLRADRYFSARLTVGAEAHRGKDRTQAVLGKVSLIYFLYGFGLNIRVADPYSTVLPDPDPHQEYGRSSDPGVNPEKFGSTFLVFSS